MNKYYWEDQLLDVLRRSDPKLAAPPIGWHMRHRLASAFSPALCLAVMLDRPDFIAPVLPDRGDGPALTDVTWENEELVRLLVRCDVRQQFGDTPLIDVIRGIHSQGAKPPSISGALQQFQPIPSLLQFVVKRCPSLRSAADDEDRAWLAILEAMLETGVLAGDVTGDTWHDAFRLSVHDSYLEAAQLFLRHGADPNLKAGGRSLALVALIFSGKDMYNILLAAGAQLHWHDWKDDSKLLWRSARGGITALRELLSSAMASGFVSQDDLNSFFVEVVEAGQVEVAQLLLDAGAEIYPPSQRSSCRSVEAAVRRADIDMLRFLLDAGAPEGEAIFQAAFHSDIKALSWCIDRGIGIDTPNQEGKTTLMAAVTPQSLSVSDQILDLILSSNPNVNHVSHDGSTALSLAVKDPGAVKRLLNAGADPNAGFGRTPLMNAARCIYAEFDSLESVSLLLSAGANINATLEDGETAYRIALRYGQPDVAKLLDEAGASEPEIRRSDIRAAIRWGRTDDVLRLIDEGADLEQADSYGRTPLLAALMEHRKDVLIERLLAKGANPNCSVGKGHDCVTALTFAIRQSRPDLVRILIAHGADASDGGDGDPPLAVAFFDVLKDFRRAASRTAASPMPLNVVRLILESGASPNIRHGVGSNPLLHVTAATNNVALMELLIEHGADLEIPAINSGFEGRTALHFACLSHNPEAVQCLLEHGANPNAASSGDFFPLFLACCSGQLEQNELERLQSGVPAGDFVEMTKNDERACSIVKLLLDHGAKVSPPLNTGDMSAIRKAREVPILTEPRCEMIRLLLDAGAPD